MKTINIPRAHAYSSTIERLYRIKNASGSKDDIAMDLGAHVGIFSINIASKVGCLVHAYEPHLENFNYLLEHIRLNDLMGRVRPFKEAIWEKDGKANLSIDSVRSLSDSHTLYDIKDRDKMAVKTISPKTLFKRTGDKDICYLKINCEGGEYFILKYLANDLDCLNRIKRICIEIHPDLLRPSWMIELVDILEIITKTSIPMKILFASKWRKTMSKKLASFEINTL